MFRIVWKSFRANGKNFLAFFISVIMAVNMLFLLMYIQEAVSRIRGIKTKALVFAYSSEQAKMLRIVIPVILVVAVMVAAYSVRFYVQSRMRDYGMLTVFGIRKRDMRKMILAEYTLSCGLSCVIGLVLGKLCSVALGKWLEKSTEQSFVNAIHMGKVYRMTGLLCVALIVGVILAIRVMLEEKGITEAAKQKVVREERMTSHRSLVFLAVGLGLIAAGLLLVWRNPFSANMAMLFLCLGVFLSVGLGLGYLLERFRRSEYYRRRILEWDWFYHYFSRSKFRIVIQTMIGIVVIYFSFLMLRGTLYERLMPNDFACVAKSGNGFAAEFQEKFGGEQKKFPFVWVNERGGDSRIGITVSDYNRLFGGQETLAADEAVIIWREEGVMPGGGQQGRTEENLYLGHCTNSEQTGAEQYTHDFRVKREEKRELLGFSFTGLVILPDETVENAAKNEKFHQEFMLLNVDESRLADATAYVEKARDDGALEEAFCRKTIEEIDRKENALNRMIVGIVAVTVLFFSMFVTWLMSFAELEQRKERYHFLAVSGMREKERKKTLRKEFGRTIWMPGLLTILLAGSLCKIFLRGYYGGGAFDGRKAEILLGVILLVYTLLELLFLGISTAWMQKQVIEE